MLHAIAIDDEPLALEVIKNLSAKIAFIRLDACFTNAFEAMGHLGSQRVDLLFLDIKMPDISGIDFLRSLPDPPMIVFTTAYSEHAVQSFELDAIDYLLKPFSAARFLKACNKVHEQFELKRNRRQAAGEPEHIYIKSGYEQVRVGLEEILYVESSGNYMQFVLTNRKIMSRLTMNEAEALLPASVFIRIHRSYIVSKKRISKFDRRSVWVGQTELPLGPGYADGVEKLIKNS